ncbi:amino acid adenylation domain-containing protein [Tenacibaculum gallaicum]|uniref:Amino acid adenylation domain-containing protein n=1 Tax=Tenacibaculum gallaicum TaxID=561505 RepID=A0A3E0I8B3_9FLAO|nr:condensation domain-containing protein [Tenacibaculum gallaicum]REH54900.1 amino acid adenylation domain-containing protein [Tenacibaculum gallaicum]
MNKKVIHTVFENTVAKYPANISVKTENRTLSYLKLNEIANKLAHTINSLNIEDKGIISVLFEERLYQLVSLLGIFKSGKVYLPLDSKYQEKHWKEMYKLAPKVMLTSNLNHDKIKYFNKQLDYQIPLVINLSLNETNDLKITLFKLIKEEYIEEDIHIGEEYNNPDFDIDGDDSSYIFFTSGSTGTPKAVLGKHKSLSHFIHWESKELEVNENDRLGQIISYSFDASLKDIFISLINGATLCIPSEDIKQDTLKLTEWILKEKITLMHMVPTMFRLLTGVGIEKEGGIKEFPSLKYILLAGEKLYNKDILNWRKFHGKKTGIYNFYGTTESTILSTYHKIENQLEGKLSDVLCVGKPISNTRVLIVNSKNEICRVNEKGSVYIRTPFLSKGYYNNEKQTLEKFIQNPLSKEKEIVYDTGDYGIYNEERDIVILGRKDGMVKLNGVRIDVNSIEKVILEIEDVSMVKCMVFKEGSIDASLVCFYKSDYTKDEDIKNYCSKFLSLYEIPSMIFKLNEFPMTANGKVDGVDLYESISERITSREMIEPKTEVEKVLVKLWKEVLVIENLGINDNFLFLGGNSIKQILLRTRIKKEFGVAISIEEIFLNPTIHELGQLLEDRKKKHKVKVIESIPKLEENREEGYIVSNEQMRIWVTSQSEKESIAHNMPHTYNIEGELNTELFKKVLQQVVNRHEVLRTSFKLNKEGDIVQIINENIDVNLMFSYNRIDNSNTSFIDKSIADFSETLFNFEQAPLFKIMLLQLEETKFKLCTVMHHIIGDYTSDQILIKEIVDLYINFKDNKNIDLEPLKIQYKDYANWIKNRIQLNEFVKEKEFWSGCLKNLNKQSKWYNISEEQRFEGGYVIRQLSEKLVVDVKELCLKHNYNLMGVISAALGVLVYKTTSQKNVVIGVPVNLRNHPDLLNQVGLYLNLLPLNVTIKEEDSVKDLVKETLQKQIKMIDNSFYPFDLIVDDFEQQHKENLIDRIDVYVNYINHEDSNINIENLTVYPEVRKNKKSKFPICFYISNYEESISFRIEYQVNIFSETEIEKIANRFIKCLEEFTYSPDKKIGEIDVIDKETIPSFSF